MSMLQLWPSSICPCSELLESDRCREAHSSQPLQETRAHGAATQHLHDSVPTPVELYRLLGKVFESCIIEKQDLCGKTASKKLPATAMWRKKTPRTTAI